FWWVLGCSWGGFRVNLATLSPRLHPGRTTHAPQTRSAQQELKNLGNDYTYVFKYFSQKMLYWGKKKEVAFGNLHPKK
ncbi:hypothetical protein ACS126_10885, partial [Sphingobacterium lactis]|uniref:hypothetical protein n=1 Tax=Sphingobacterium lactis TaxID=797291 RepID=UPI003EC943FC